MAFGPALHEGAIRFLARRPRAAAREPKPICGPALCGGLAGPVDQRKIAAFARRKPWVQIPPGPFLRCHTSRVPHLPQKESCGSRAAPHVGHAYSIRVPHFPQNVSWGPSAAPQFGQPPSSGGGFAAHSAHRITEAPFLRAGFHEEVFFPHSAQVRSRASDASTSRTSGCAGGSVISKGSSSSGGRAMAPAIPGNAVKPSAHSFSSFGIVMDFRRGAASGESSSRYVR